MPCDHRHGGLQFHIYERGAWRLRCLCCAAEETAADPGYPADAGSLACRGFQLHAQGRYAEAAEAFLGAWESSGDARFRFAALLCPYGVSFCGDECQPTLGAYPLPGGSPADSEDWLTVEAALSPLGSQAYQHMREALLQLEDILAPLRQNVGRRGCDVFLCCRRTPANVQAALEMYRELTAVGLAVFCADVTTRGKTQEQFESEVYHALNTAEYLVLFPGDGEDALTPWLRNELQRAAAPREHRFICAPGRSLPDAAAREGIVLPPEELRARLLPLSGSCTAPALYARALEALRAGSHDQATRLLHRACAKGSAGAALMICELYQEGLLLPADAALAAQCRRLAGEASDSCRQEVHQTVSGLEQTLGVARRQALIYLVADVSDAAFVASQTLTAAVVSALNADRHLSSAELCLIGYDRHARVLEEPKALRKYGLPEHAARALRTTREAGFDRAAYAAKGLRCAGDHLRRCGGMGREPLLLLLRPCQTDDSLWALPAAFASLEGEFRNLSSAQITCADQIPGCIAALKPLMQ